MFLWKFKEYHIINKKLNKHAYELLCNIELLCFVDQKKIKKYLEIFHDEVFITDEEKTF